MARRHALMPAVLLALCAAAFSGEPELTVTDPWIAATPPVVAVNAGYLQLANNAEHAVTLTGVTSPRFGRIEMHRTEMQDGVSTMRHERSLEVPAGQTLSFAPGGLHLMLFSGSPPPRVGEEIPLTLHLADGRQLDITAAVRPPSSGTAAHHH